MGASRSLKIASRLIQAGVVACVLAIIPSGVTGMCLCNAPKELVLELAGLAAAALCVYGCSREQIDSVDLPIAAFLVLSAISGTFAATDRWEALRAVGISIGGAAIFWSSRALGSRGEAERLLNSAAVAVTLVALTVVLDALGFGFGLSVIRPGGTLGHRNSAAHFVVLGIPVLILLCLRAGDVRRERLALLALMLAGAALLLTRSRAAWLAAIPGALVPLALLSLTPSRLHPSLEPGRVLRPALAIIAGLVIGACIPIRLHWKTAHPYAESLEHLTEAQRGSGRVRIRQYRDSLALLADHKTLGVGPGNWKILYQPGAGIVAKQPARDAAAGDRGLVVRTVWYLPNRLNSDWIAFAVERGLPAAAFVMVALAMLALRSGRSWLKHEGDAAEPDASIEHVVLMALIGALLVVGSLDAVLQLAAPTYLVFLVMGVIAPVRPLFSVSPSGLARSLAMAAILSIATVLAAFTLNEIYVSYLIARAGSGDLSAAYRISFDERWFVTEVVWSERATRKDLGQYPACD